MATIAFSPKRPGSLLGHAASGPQPPTRTHRGARLLGRLMTVAIAAALVLPLAEGTQTADAGKKNKLVTRTISSRGPIVIPSAGSEGPADPYPSTIKVKAFKKFKKAKIKDVNLILRDFNHTSNNNVDVMLVHGDRQATVMSDVAGNNASVDLTITLDDEASQGLPGVFPIATGAWRPSNRSPESLVDGFPAPAPPQIVFPTGLQNIALSTFDGAKPDGSWRLFVQDDTSGDTGNIAGGWSLEITAKIKEKKGKKNKNRD
jgi:hypothetical protein